MNKNKKLNHKLVSKVLNRTISKPHLEGNEIAYEFDGYLIYEPLSKFVFKVKKWSAKYGIIICSYVNAKGNGVARIRCGLRKCELHVVSRKTEELAILDAAEWIYNNIIELDHLIGDDGKLIYSKLNNRIRPYKCIQKLLYRLGYSL